DYIASFRNPLDLPHSKIFLLIPWFLGFHPLKFAFFPYFGPISPTFFSQKFLNLSQKLSEML
ncbi:hypothetical protein CH360_15080, partial [Leptospira perolatii]